MNAQYTTPKPGYSLIVKALAVVVVMALAGLCFVAFETFSLIDNKAVAVAFALTIELGAAADALAILRKNRPAIIGLIISLLVSGLYNFTHANQANAGLAVQLGGVELWALAIGPLSATLFLSLTLGSEITKHEAAVKAWQDGRAAWEETQVQEAKRAQVDREERDRLEREKAAQMAAQERVQIERDRLASEERTRAQEIAAKDRENQRQARLQAAQIKLQSDQLEVQKATIEVQQESNRTPVRPVKGTYEDFCTAMRSNGSHKWTGEMVKEKFGVSESTGWNWIRRHREEHPTPVMEVN